MAIYPIITGQKPDQRNVIPPRTPGPAVNSQPVMQPEQHTGKPSQDDLIDFSQNDAPATPAPVPVPVPAAGEADITNATQSKDEIEKLLHSTGKPAEGPLIDFQDDMKKDLPSAT